MTKKKKPELAPIELFKGKVCRLIRKETEKIKNVGRMHNEPEFTIIPVWVYNVLYGTKWKVKKLYTHEHAKIVPTSQKLFFQH